MSKHGASKKEKKSRLVLNTFLIFLGVTAICAGVIFAVILMPTPEQTLKAPAASTMQPAASHIEKTAQQSTPKPSAEPKTSAQKFTKVSASGMRAPYKTESGTITYPPSNAFDNNKDTVWTPDPQDENPWIELTATSEQSVNGIEIVNGYSKNKKLYEANSRAKEVIVECNGTRYSYTLQDKGAGKAQRLSFPGGIKTEKIRITINSVYKGSEYDDLCIAEITPY